MPPYIDSLSIYFLFRLYSCSNECIATLLCAKPPQPVVKTLGTFFCSASRRAVNMVVGTLLMCAAATALGSFVYTKSLAKTFVSNSTNALNSSGRQAPACATFNSFGV
jgi:hypothetical protein